jgi:hypothetical protein
MATPELGEDEVARIKVHLESHPVTLALVRTEHAPAEFASVLKSLAGRCQLSLRNTLSSPNSDMGIAELESKDRRLIVLFIGGERTELLSVSETDDATVKDIEDSIHSSNFLSEIIRMGL